MLNSDRKNAPDFGKIEKLEIQQATLVKLDNGIPLYYIHAGSQDVIKLELIFNAGKIHQSKSLVASTTSSLIDDGTHKYSSSEIAEKIDFYGAYLGTKNNYDFADLTIHCQTRHLKEILPLLLEMMTEATFPENELEIHKQNSKAKIIQELERVEVMASNKFNEVIFGKSHPYGSSNNPEDCDALTREDILRFYQMNYRMKDSRIVLSGKVSDQVIREINSIFGITALVKSENISQNDNAGKEFFSTPEKKHFLKKEKAVQSAIRIGKTFINKTHPDYGSVRVLNTLLGGYFGSRLMSNIREDKGYTYGIHSGISSYQKNASILISTEVGAEVTDDAVKEIFLEIKKLREILVDEQELQLVKNYLMGSFMRSIDGPFGLADIFINLNNYNLDYEYYEQYFQTVKSVTPKRIRDLAVQYFSEDSFYTVVAGQ